MKKWIAIKDTQVRTIWVCRDCKITYEISPDWFQNNGTPVCEKCDRDMIYLRTEVKQ